MALFLRVKAFKMKHAIGILVVLVLLVQIKGCDDCYQRGGEAVRGPLGYVCVEKR